MADRFRGESESDADGEDADTTLTYNLLPDMEHESPQHGRISSPRRGRRRGMTRGYRGRGVSRRRVSSVRGGRRRTPRSVRGRGALAASVETRETTTANRRAAWEEHCEAFVSGLGDADLRFYMREVMKRHPSLIFSIKASLEAPAPQPSSPSLSAPLGWCVCDHCVEMPTEEERRCCGKRPQLCASMSPMMDAYVLDEGVLLGNILYREDVFALDAVETEDVGERHRSFRHAAYRHYILYRFGRLTEGDRRVIPSCIVKRVRARFPDPNGTYTGYQSGRLS